MTDTEQTSRKGINAVEAIFLEMGWIFREQPTSDFGVDAQAEIKLGKQATGRLIALQIKSGVSYFKKRGENFVYYGSGEHLEYWTNHSLPVFLILHNPDTKVTLWQKIDRDAVEETEDGNWCIEIPPSNLLDRSAERYLQRGAASTDASIRRLRLAMDEPIIRKVSELAANSVLFMVIDEWVNKSLNMRSVTFMLDDPHGDPVLTLEPWMPAPDIHFYMNELFPWLDYEYAEEPDYDASEVMGHYFEVKTNNLVTSFLTMEDFYREGRESKEPDTDIIENDTEPFDEDELRRLVEKGPFGDR